VKLEVIWLVQDWRENTDGAIGRYSVEHEIIPTFAVNIGHETLEGICRLDVRGKRHNISLTGRG